MTWRELSNRAGAVVLATAVAMGVSGCEESDPAGPSETIVELASANGDLETLAAAIGAAGLDTELSGAGPFTVFAPADASFEGLESGTVELLLASENLDVLQELLLGHVVSGSVSAADLSDGQVLTTLSGDELTVSIEGGEVRIDGALVQTADVGASNGVVHVIGGVLTEGLNVAEQLRTSPSLSTLAHVVDQLGLMPALADEMASLTVFTPTDAAFAAIDVPTDPAVVQEIVLYHVVGAAALSTSLTDGQMLTTLQGGDLTVQIDGSGVSIVGAQSTAGVGAADVVASNGVIHVVDTVLLPPM
jgi:uncharacterized surface protein with fasciclin (FAS1) repeats